MQVITSKVESKFDLHETLEGSKDAFFVVNHLLGEHDWEGLRGMVSPKLLCALRDTCDEYGSAGLVWRTELEGDLQARLHGLSFLDAEAMAQYSELHSKEAGEAAPAPASERVEGAHEPAAEAPAAEGPSDFKAAAADASSEADKAGGAEPAPWPAGAWMVLTVQLRGEQLTTISREDDGQLVAELRDERWTRWRFATGPLPDNLPAEQLETQWCLLSV